MPAIKKIQLGKKGITENFITSLKNQFNDCRNIKISVLKSAGRENLKKYEQQIIKELGLNFTARTIGFTINIKKWRKVKK